MYNYNKCRCGVKLSVAIRFSIIRATGQWIVHSEHKRQHTPHSAKTLKTIQHGGTLDWSKAYHRQRESCTMSVSVCSSHYIHSAAPSHQLWRAFTWVDRWLSWGSTAANRGALTCQLSVSPPKTSSVMSSPPCQSQWHIKFVSGNSVGYYNLIQHCPEQNGELGNYYATEMIMEMLAGHMQIITIYISSLTFGVIAFKLKIWRAHWWEDEKMTRV